MPTQFFNALNKMDLRPYGIQITLEKGMNLNAHLHASKIRTGYFSKHRGLFVLPSGRYSIGAFLGKGSYATIYTATHETTNKSYSMKILPLEKATLESYLRECIVHILLAKESANEKNGPYVPRFYEVVHDTYNNLIIIRTETIQDILFDRFRAGTREENDNIIPHAISQIAEILDFFYKRLRFNHRDLKPNNVLYNYNPDTGYLDIKIIDFGLSCLCWNDINIHAGDRFPGTCFRPSRDLTQFLYATYTDRAFSLSTRLRSVMEDMLTFQVEGRTCRMWEGCRGYGNPLQVWAHTYRFMDDPRIENPNATPKRVMERMLEFLGFPKRMKTVERRSIVGLPHCIPEKVLNPKTRRCIRRSSPEGQRILRLSKRYSTPSAKTMRQYRKSKHYQKQKQLR